MRPVVEIVMPASLAGQSNGQLDPSLLVAVDDAGNLLESHAAVAWLAMDAACFAAVGKHLRIGNSYRTLERQTEIFEERFTLQYDPMAKVRAYWRDLTWYLRAGQNTAAVPGNSNHGYGLAVDTADDTTYHPDVAAWLLEHASGHGWSWEKSIDATEPWHLCYFAGDHPPVTAEPAPEPLPDEVDMIRLVVVDDPAGAQLVLGAGTLTWIASGTLPPIYDFARVPSANVTVAQVHDILRTHDTIGQAPGEGALLGAW